MKRTLGLIGADLSYSVSPSLHAKIGELLGAEVVYSKISVSEASLNTALQDLLEQKYDGLNVTIPHKQTILKFLNSVENDAERIGAVNVLKPTAVGWRGFNSDAKGFLEPLLRRSILTTGRRVLVFGAGGAARAVCYALCEQGVASITVCSRRLPQAVELSECMKRLFSNVCVDFCDNLENVEHTFDLVVQCTPVGGITAEKKIWLPLKAVSFSRTALACDLVYNPKNTQFLIEAEKLGLRTISGLEMLVAQALNSWEIWFDLPKIAQTDFDVLVSRLC